MVIKAYFANTGASVGTIVDCKIDTRINDISLFEITIVGINTDEVKTKYQISYLPKSEIKIFNNENFVMGGYIEEIEYSDEMRTLVLRGSSYEILLTLNYTPRNVLFTGSNKTAYDVWVSDSSYLLQHSDNDGTPYVVAGDIDNSVKIGSGSGSTFRVNKETLYKALVRFCNALDLDFWVSTSDDISVTDKKLNISQSRGDSTKIKATFGSQSSFRITGYKKNIYSTVTDVEVLGRWDGKYQDRNAATASDNINARSDFGQIDYKYQDSSLNETDGSSGLAQTIANTLRDNNNKLSQILKFKVGYISYPLSVGDYIHLVNGKYDVNENRRIKRLVIETDGGIPQYQIELFDVNDNTSDTITNVNKRIDDSNIQGMGAVNMWQINDSENATNSKPMYLRFYIPSDVKVQNKATLHLKVDPLRYYTSDGGITGWDPDPIRDYVGSLLDFTTATNVNGVTASSWTDIYTYTIGSPTFAFEKYIMNISHEAASAMSGIRVRVYNQTNGKYYPIDSSSDNQITLDTYMSDDHTNTVSIPITGGDIRGDTIKIQAKFVNSADDNETVNLLLWGWGVPSHSHNISIDPDVYESASPSDGGTLSGDWGDTGSFTDYSATYDSSGNIAGTDGSNLINSTELTTGSYNILKITPTAGQKHYLKPTIYLEVYIESD